MLAVLLSLVTCQSFVNLTLFNQTIVQYQNETNTSFGIMTRLFIKHIPTLITNTQNHSIFIPRDVQDIQTNQELELIKYHIVPQPISQTRIPNYYTTLSGSDIKIRRDDVYTGNNSNSTILGSVVVQTITVYFVDTVFVPPPFLDTLLVSFDTGSLNDILASVQPFLWPTEHFTFLLPTKQAINTFIQETCGNVTSFKSGVLLEILQTHVITSKVYSGIVGDGNVTTRASKPLLVSIAEGIQFETKYSSAKVIKDDILLDNGVVHVIDKVLVPRNTIVCIERVFVTESCVASSIPTPPVITTTVTETRNAACTGFTTTTSSTTTTRVTSTTATTTTTTTTTNNPTTTTNIASTQTRATPTTRATTAPQTTTT